MADDKRTIAQLDRPSLYPPTPPPTTSPDSPTRSETLPTISGFDKIIAELRNRSRGRPQVEEEWWCVSLGIDEFDTLEARIEADEDLYGFVADKIKYDYFPRFAKFVLRMADTLHEAVLMQFQTHIIQQLLSIEHGNDQAAADFARRINATGSPKVKAEEEGTHCPDGSFRHRKARRHGVVIEVSHSQKRKDLPYLADDYILGSDGLTQLVIGIDLEYQEKKGKEAKVITWRPRYLQEQGTTVLVAAQTEECIFRAADGSLADDQRFLRIGLKDFGNPFDCPGIDGVSGEITIPFTQLYRMVQEGEATVQTMKQGTDNVRPPGLVKRKRVRSPPEELRPSDEKRFKAAEKEVDEQLYYQENEYIPGGLAGSEEMGAIRRGPPRKAKGTEGPATSGEAS